MKLKRHNHRNVWASLYTAAGGSKQEHATLSARRGLKILAVSREAGCVLVLPGDWGSSGMWDSHHLTSFTPTSPENEPWPHLGVCVSAWSCVQPLNNMSNCVKAPRRRDRSRACAGLADLRSEHSLKSSREGSLCRNAGYILSWRTDCACFFFFHCDFRINK